MTPDDCYVVRTYGTAVDFWTHTSCKAISAAINLCQSGQVQGLITVSYRGFVIFRCTPTDHLLAFYKTEPEKLGGYYWFTMT